MIIYCVKCYCLSTEEEKKEKKERKSDHEEEQEEKKVWVNLNVEPFTVLLEYFYGYYIFYEFVILEILQVFNF